MNKKPVIIAIIILLTGIIGVWGYQYAKDMPRVSQENSKKILLQYKNNLQELYIELNATYDQLKTDGDPAEWESFSKEWIPKLLNSRPKVIDKKFPGEYENKKAILMAAQKDFLPLWNEYNSQLNGKKGDMREADELKNRIEEILESLDI